ncbi:MAG TPA: glycosyltransferase [Pseudonocardia sp.]|jgi:glycosyltransferase involved in cell wall biosynthesis
MRIAEVLLRPAFGGAESLVESLRRRWAEDGHEVRVLYLDGAGEAETGRAARVRRLGAALRELRPDVVHAHSALPNLYARLASRGRWPVVTVLHSAGRDFDATSLRLAERALAGWTSHVVAVSPAQVREYHDSVGTRVPVSLIRNGVRPDIVARTVPVERPARVVAVGRLDPQKRIDVLLEGWRRAELTGCALSVAGVASDEATQRQVEGWATGAPAARLLGAVTDIPGLLAGSDLFVHAATEEAHPLAPLEAARAGLPLVVTGRVAALLPDELAVVRFDGGDPDGLAVALRTAVAEYPALAARAVAQAPRVAEEFGIDRCAAGHLALLLAAVRSDDDERCSTWMSRLG